MATVFISYVREDEAYARRLYNDLRAARVDSWIDREDLLPGEKWRDTIVKAIKNSRYFLALLSNNSVSKRGFYQREVKLALEVLEEQPPNEIYLIPVRLDPCNPTDGRLLELHWLDLFPSYEEGFRKLLRVVRAVGEQIVAQPMPPLTEASAEAVGDVIIAHLSKEEDTSLVRWVGTVAGRLASQRRGALFTVGDHESVLKWSYPNRGELMWQKIDFSQVGTSSSSIEQDDGATMISEDGRVLQSPIIFQLPFVPRGILQASLGSRHHAAIGISAITRALCIAVSVDGIISAFLAGQYLLRVRVKKEDVQNL